MLYAGIDWSDSALEYHLRAADGAVLAEGTAAPTVAGLADLFTTWERHGPPSAITVTIEGTRAAWIQSLLDRGYTVLPVNPKVVDHFRQSLSANGEKCDRIDAGVLARYGATFHDRARPLRIDDPDLVALRIACEDRLRLVEEQTAKRNELTAALKIYGPVFLPLFGDLNSAIALTFLRDFPTQRAIQTLKPKRLRAWLKGHSYPCPQRVDGMVAALQTPALPVAEHLQQAKAPLLQYLAEALLDLKDRLSNADRQITDRLARLPDTGWVKSLPGAGAVLEPSLVACFGRDPERFATVGEAQAFFGTAPVTEQSGRTRIVRFRWGCWKFARRTLCLFADQSRHLCAWAAEVYARQRASGHTHAQALRAIAHKWVKIILALIRTGCPYDEAVFQESQRRHRLTKSAVQPTS